MLKIKNLTLKPFFENINFEIDKGLVIFSGPSGSGKTTLLKTIGGFIKPDKGEVLLIKDNSKGGSKISFQSSDNLLNKSSTIPLGFHFQDYNLLDLDVKTNIELPFILGKYKKDEKWIDYLLNYFEIKKLVNKNISEISGGEKERVSIVKAFANKPYLVLLDEAGAALNEELKTKLYDFIKDYSQNNIVILITHDNNFIKQLKLKEIYNGNFKILLT